MIEDRSFSSRALKGVLAVSVVALTVQAATGQTDTRMDATLKKSAEAAEQKGLEWLASLQKDDGGWSDENYPSLTAFPMWAFARSGDSKWNAVVAKAVDCIIKYQADSGLHAGAIYRVVLEKKGGGLPNYNTAVCIAALADVESPKATAAILAGREFLVRSQYLGQNDPLHYGGMGYDPPTKRSYTDLSNSYLAYEAMRRTAHFEDLRADGRRVTLDWKAALAYIQHCHNDPEFNDLSWASGDLSEVGGFAYRPDEFRPTSGSFEKEGVVKFRSMPGMTYAGLLSYIHAGVGRSDPRVKATVEWITRHWQLEKGNRNPEMAGKPEELEGLYYMYNVLAKGMAASGRDELKLTDGNVINWRDELVNKLVGLQRKDGTWINENSRYWEGNEVLVTAYTVLALQTVLGR